MSCWVEEGVGCGWGMVGVPDLSLGYSLFGGGTSVPGQGNGVKRRVLIGCG